MVIANVLGFFSFMFLLWKKLKDDYPTQKVFSMGFVCSLSILIGSKLSTLYFKEWVFIAEVIFLTIGYLAFINIKKMRFYETLDAISVASLLWLLFSYFAKSVITPGLISFIPLWVVALSLFLYFFTSANYRKFSWYKSGRVGIAASISLVFLFLAKIIVAIIFPGVLSFGGIWQTVSSVFLFVAFVIVFVKLFYSK